MPGVWPTRASRYAIAEDLVYTRAEELVNQNPSCAASVDLAIAEFEDLLATNPEGWACGLCKTCAMHHIPMYQLADDALLANHGCEACGGIDVLSDPLV